jgi:hypothetical protein
MEDLDKDDNKVLSPGNWENITMEDCDMLYRHLYAEYKDFNNIGIGRGA